LSKDYPDTGLSVAAPALKDKEVARFFFARFRSCFRFHAFSRFLNSSCETDRIFPHDCIEPFRF